MPTLQRGNERHKIGATSGQLQEIVDSGFKYKHPKCVPRLNIIIFQIYTTLWYLLAGPRGDVFLTDNVYSIFLVRLFTSQKCLLYVHYPDSLYTREVPNISLKKLFS